MIYGFFVCFYFLQATCKLLTITITIGDKDTVSNATNESLSDSLSEQSTSSSQDNESDSDSTAEDD